MTYNFDPDRWFEIERAALEAKRRAGDLDDEAFADEMRRLAERYEEMLARIDMICDYRNAP